MLLYNRTLLATIQEKMGKGKAIILLGPRQVGKTTLIKTLLKKTTYLFLDADDPTVQTLLSNPNTAQLNNIIGNHSVVFIDEAQRLHNIGITLKLITDQFKEVQLLVSGSSAFELVNQTNEPLTGRKWQYNLYPLSWEEIEQTLGFVKAHQQLQLRLVFGSYPDVLNYSNDAQEILQNLVNSYLYKDILAFSGIRKPEILEKLLQALAFQIGNEVSYNELAQTVGVDKNTINNYITLLEQGFVIFKLKSFSRNLRNEIKYNQKIYFYDVGVRNAIIGNFSTHNLRQDIGQLWENFLISERLKQNMYYKINSKGYFWRTVHQQEIDYVEEGNGIITGYEIKWNAKSKVKKHKSFMEKYNAEIHTINQDNFRDFIVFKGKKNN